MVTPLSEAIDLLDRHKSLAARRDQWRPLWQELAQIFLPNQAQFTMPMVPGRESSRELYDTTPMQARRGLATAIDGLLKPSTTRWFWMAAGDERLNDLDEVKTWFDDVQDRMWRAIYNPRARFIEASGAVDSDLATFGLGHLWIVENAARNGLTFKALFIGDVAFDENSDGLVDTYTLTRRFTARQAQQRFGDQLPAKVTEELKNPAKAGNAPKTFEFVQCISPRHEYDPRKKDQPNKRFASKIVSVEDQEIVETGGFDELPISTPRWELAPGEIYPRSPAMIALPDARTLQAMGHTLLVGGQRAVDPPIWIADDGVLSAVRTFPGGLTVVDSEIVRQTGGRPMGQLDVGANIPIGRDMQSDYRSMVEAAFFKNVFNLPVEGRQMTATEVMERKEEFLRTIGPVMGQLEASYIGHTVERVFGIMLRAGALPPVPKALQGQDVAFEYMSPIQQARKQIEAAALARSLEFIAPIGAIDPSVYDNFDADAIVRDLPDMFSTPNKWLKPRDQVEAFRQQRAEAQAQAAGMAGVGQMAQTGKTLSEMDKNISMAAAQ
jgi:hypothetical protein